MNFSPEDVLIDSHPDSVIQKSPDMSSLPSAEETMDLQVNRHASAPTVEFLQVSISGGQSLCILDYDASRQRVRIWSTYTLKAPAVQISSSDISGIVNGVTTNDASGILSGRYTLPGVNLRALGGAQLEIQSQSEVWLYGVPNDASDGTPTQVSLMIERYASA